MHCVSLGPVFSVRPTCMVNRYLLINSNIAGFGSFDGEYNNHGGIYIFLTFV